MGKRKRQVTQDNKKDTKNNIIYLKDHFKKKTPQDTKKNKSTSPKSSVLSFDGQPVAFSLQKNRRIKAEKRLVKRMVLNGLIGVTISVPMRGLMRVEVQDISSEGVSFDIAHKQGAFEKGDFLELRLYLNHEVYVPFSVEVQNKKTYFRNGQKTVRHGVKFDKENLNKDSLNSLLKFLDTVASSCKRDSGDRIISDGSF